MLMPAGLDATLVAGAFRPKADLIREHVLQMQTREPGHRIGARVASLSICFFLMATASEAAGWAHDPACVRACNEKAHAACLDATNEHCYREHAVSCQKACPTR
jgi:hypothetical protein